MDSAPNLVLVGPMGAGKTSVGRRLGERYGLAFVDADREIEARTGATVNTIFDCEGEAGFRERERTTLAELLAAEGSVVATGGGAVVDPATRRLLRERGFVVHLHVAIDQQLHRLARDRTRPLIAGADRAEVLARLARERDALYADVADLRFDTGTSTAAEAAARLHAVLATRWPRANAPVAATTDGPRA